MAVTGACNFFSDTTRTNACTLADGTVLEGDEASYVFDVPLLLCAIYHLIQWLRTTLLLTSIVVGLRCALYLWYATSLVFVYGVVVMAVCHIVYFKSEEGLACREAQTTRGQWLFAECAYFWSLFFICQCPPIYITLYPKRKIHQILIENEASDE